MNIYKSVSLKIFLSQIVLLTLNPMKNYLIILLTTISLSGFSQIKQRSSTEGISVGFQVGRLGWNSDYFKFLSDNAGSGFNIGLNLSYGINQLVEPYLTYDYSSVGTSAVSVKSFSFSHLDAGVRFNFGGTVNQLRPYVQAGYGLRNGSLSQVAFTNGSVGDVSFGGGTPHVGGGLNYFITPSLALNLKGNLTFGTKPSVLVDNQDTFDKADVGTFRLSVGVVYNLN
jgi:hypothetical protein